MVGKPDEVPPIQQEFQRVIDAAEGRHVPLRGVERFAFYEQARKAYAIVCTTDPRPYGCVIVKKGVILGE